jgi:diguanylate cyclase (GGDEF)-like protein
MVRHMALLNFLFLLIALMFRRYWIYKPENDLYFLPEALVACSILAATIVFAGMLIGFQEEKTNFINRGLRQQIEMQDQLNRDQQTGLHGQTLFINTLSKMVDKVDHPLQLVVIDIDDFKKVNDSYGHLRGDEIILKLVELMKEIFKHEYFISRYGGEEFTIICKDSDLEYLVVLLEKLRLAFESHKYEFMEERVTISIGIAQYQPGWSAERLFEAADQAMYVSKRKGKNRISIYKECKQVTL